MKVDILVDELEVELEEDGVVVVELGVVEDEVLVLVTTILMTLVGRGIGGKGLTHPSKLFTKPRAAPAR